MSEIERLLKACVGAVETVAEKTGDLIGNLAEKGTPAYEEAVKKGGEVLDTIRSTIKNENVRSDMEELTERIGEFTRDQLELLRNRIIEAEEKLDREMEERKQAGKAQDEKSAGVTEEDAGENAENNEDGEKK